MNAMYNLKRLGKLKVQLLLSDCLTSSFMIVHRIDILIPRNVQNTLTVPLLSARQFAEYCRSIAQFTFLSLHTFGSALSS